jgi:IMP dehydrogenase
MPQYNDKILFEGLTYDDVLVVPAHSKVLPYQVNLQTNLTRNIRINVPIVSAAMDTVTEYELAIAMARMGGIGIIHKNMPVRAQAEQVRKVKRSESGLITDPVTLHESATVGEAIKLMRDNKIGGIPIINDERILVGILTNRDLRFEGDMSKGVSEAMTKERLVTAEMDTDFIKAEEILKANKVEKLPVVDKDGRLKGLITFKDITKLKSYPHSCKDAQGRLRVGAGVGVTRDIEERVSALMKAEVDVIVIDTAHGHSQFVLESVRSIKDKFPELEIIAGNVATAEGAKALADAGADAVKVGVGPGSICTTRVIAGIGMPQLTAILECAAALKGTGIPIIADGGIRFTGDIVKAIAAGAGTIMAGSIFAGVEEAPGETIIYEGRKFKTVWAPWKQ